MSLVLDGISLHYGPRQVLNQVCFEVPDGQVTGFLGHNGAGKTTAMRIVLGLLPGYEGRVLVDQRDALKLPREARARTSGLIESCGFHPAWSGARNLYELARLAGLERTAARAETGLRLEQVGLTQAAERAVRGYSQGMRQRLGIAQALLGKPRNILLDEPTNGLDPEGIAEMRRLFQRLAHEEGCAVILSSHLLGEITELADRIVVLRQGQVVANGSTRELLADSHRRYRLGGPELQRLSEALNRQGITHKRVGTSQELELELENQAPSEVLAQLVRQGLPVEHFAPRPLSLEEFYLATRAGNLAAPQTSGLQKPGKTPPKPAEIRVPSAAVAGQNLAPQRPYWLVLRHELSRLRGLIWLLLLPAALGLVSVLRRALALRAETSEVEGETLFSATDQTAFASVSGALLAGLPLVLVLSVGFASQLFSAELARGTLRNVLLRPLGRVRIFLAKASLACLASFAAYGLLLAATCLFSLRYFQFGDLEEILPNGMRVPILSAKEVLPEFRSALLSPLIPLAALSSLGLLVGCLVRSGSLALSLSLGLVVFLDLVRSPLGALSREHYSPSSYLPTPLGGRSELDAAALFAEGATNATFRFEASDQWIPALWTLLALALAYWRFARRRIE